MIQSLHFKQCAEMRISMQDFTQITIDDLCEVINLFQPCMDDYLYVCDFENDFYYISETAIERFALPSNSFHNVTKTHKSFVYPADMPELEKELQAVATGKKTTHNMQYRWLDRNGSPVWINCRGRVLHRDGIPLYMIGCINEIGSLQKADNISGLLGLSSFKNYLSTLDKLPSECYVLRLGLDDFKAVNVNLGMDYGDMLLKKTAECISECLLPGQMLYKIISDEFIILDTIGSNEAQVISLYKQIRSRINQFVQNNQYTAVFTISGGILKLDAADDISFQSIMKLSEFSLSESKQRSKSSYYVFNSDDYALFKKHRHLTHILRRSVNNNFEGFEAYFQPVIDADTQTLYGAETLMRFSCKEYGVVSPAEFIPLLEESGLIIPAGKWILQQSMSACKKLQNIFPDFSISVNISYIQVMKSDIINEIISSVSEYGITPSHVIVELTESGLLLSDTQMTKLWKKLKKTHIKIALDDFGTGYSNFHYINDLKPDIIKIDRSFTSKAIKNKYDYNLLSLMSGMVRELNLKICVEGIENETELNKIQQLTPNYCQGYYWGKPCPFEQFVEDFVKHDIHQN